MNDLGKCGIRADTRSLCGNKTGSIDGRSRHFIAHLFVYRDTLTGDRGFINGALSRKDHAIHRNALARTYHKDIIHLDRAEGAKSHMKRHLRDLHAHGAHLL